MSWTAGVCFGKGLLISIWSSNREGGRYSCWANICGYVEVILIFLCEALSKLVTSYYFVKW